MPKCNKFDNWAECEKRGCKRMFLRYNNTIKNRK